MTLAPGARFGSYEIVAPIGAGGMGEVYRASDTKLKRDVALKVLPDSFASDPDRLARFTREAQTLASLNHPNIAHIHGLEESGGVTAIVMELVEGDDLSQRIARGAIPLDEALSIAKQIAEALEAAHEQGIIHRDLKPANIKVRDDGVVKVLDFGLAKALDPTSSSGAEAMNSPTLTARATQLGVILGTAAYMAPEQAKGRPVDKRADIWAFGVVLYEMLAGARPFGGDDVTDVLAAVVRAEPDWTALPAATPTRIRELLRHCLTKDARLRLHDIADARLEVDDAIGRAAEPQPVVMPSGPSRRHERLVWAVTVVVLVAALVALGSVTYLGRGSQQPLPTVSRSIISVAPAEQLQAAGVSEGRPSRTAMALSADGRSLVFSAVSGHQRQLYVRALDQLDAVPMPGTEGGDGPFFSPDGKWVGFWAKGALRKVPLSGGPATAICDTPTFTGASWGPDDTIVYAQLAGGLWLVPSGGGTSRPLTTLDAKAGEYSHRLPQFLPDGKAVIFTTITYYFPDWRDARLSIVLVASGDRQDLVPGADARYASSGHLVFVRSGTLVAVPFDPAKRAVTGNSLTMLADVMQAANMSSAAYETGAGQFSLSASGSLVYVPGGIYPEGEGTIVSVDRRRGTAQTLSVPLHPYYSPRLNPRDPSQLVVWTQGVDRNVWTLDIASGTLTHLTTSGRTSKAMWTRDGKRITFAGSWAGAENLFWMPAGGGTAEPLTTGGMFLSPGSWSPDGRTLAFVRYQAETLSDVMALSVDGDRRPTPILATRFNEWYPEFSEDGRCLAYVSDDSGTDEVYVQPYPGPGPRKRISNGGGSAPAWSRDGRELFYWVSTGAGRRMMAVPITTTPSCTAGVPQKLFEGRYGTQALVRGYDVTADGQRFYFAQYNERPPVRATQMILVQNWFEELKTKVPGGVAK